MTILAEYRHGFVGSDRDDLVRLDFPGTVLVSASTQAGPVNLSGTAVVSILDLTGVVFANVRFIPASELEAFLRVPVVFGGDGSLFGGLPTYSASAGVTYRF